MSQGAKYTVGGVAVALIALWLLPNWLAMLIIAAMLATPVVAYLLLDQSQRRRLRAVRRRQLGR
jgi:hypothetical protein